MLEFLSLPVCGSITPGVPMPIRFGSGRPLSAATILTSFDDLLPDMFVALFRFGGHTHPADRAIQRVGIENGRLDLRAAEVDAPKVFHEIKG